MVTAWSSRRTCRTSRPRGSSDRRGRSIRPPSPLRERRRTPMRPKPRRPIGTTVFELAVALRLRRAPRRGRPDGFTLIELSIVILIIGLLIAFILAASYEGVQSAERKATQA